MHARRETHETPTSALYAPYAGDLGVERSAQRVPFHRSAIGSVAAVHPWWVQLSLSYSPTAMQSLGDVHDTPVRPGTFSPPPGFTGGSSRHPRPFHHSATPPIPSARPTVIHALLAVQDTASLEAENPAPCITQLVAGAAGGRASAPNPPTSRPQHTQQPIRQHRTPASLKHDLDDPSHVHTDREA